MTATSYSSSFAGFGSAVASLMFLWAMAKQFLPNQLESHLGGLASKLISLVYPYLEITIAEYSGEHLRRSEVFAAVESYLASSTAERAKRLKVDINDGQSSALVFSMDDYEEVHDVFKGVKVWWFSNKISSNSNTMSLWQPAPEDRRFYRLTFHRANRRVITNEYLPYVLNKGKEIRVEKRQRKLFTNIGSYDSYSYVKKKWSHVPFDHPATFNTVAMDPQKKEEIILDLFSFRESKDYYRRVGKPWKRGYLLYGPPGTGKSTMIAAMANLLDYDVYDLELTAVKNNSELRKLLIETTGKSIIVIEDIDCSIDLTGKRKADNVGGDGSNDADKNKMPAGPPASNEDSKVTLSGLLNFIDGLWSACGNERLIVFTTNHVDKLDSALIRRGRMDMHVELSYCCFEAFKVLAKNYLCVDSHPLFDDIRNLIADVKITPADVAETLIMRKSAGNGSDGDRADACLLNLVNVLRERKSKSENEDELSCVGN